MNYVAGFLFDSSHAEVLLIKKNRPKWQAGRYNGIGGKVENYDISCNHAMSREFKEETGVLIDAWQWNEFCEYEWEDGIVHFFSYIPQSYETFYEEVKTITDEEIKWVKLSDVWQLETIFNLKWLIPLALDPSLGRNIIKVSE